MPMDDRVRLQHLLEAAEAAARYCDGMTRAQFDKDDRTQRAVVQCLSVVGEAAFAMKPSTKDAIAGVPWPNMVGMRRRLIHEYFAINLDVVWETVQRDLSPLTAAVRNYLEAEPDKSADAD